MQSYDEDLFENKFFVNLQSKYAEIYNFAADNRYMICVPRTGHSSSKYLYTEEDYRNHILIPVDDTPGTFKTANDKEVTIQSGVITTGQGFKDVRNAHILFEETYFNDHDESFRVLCIDIALEGGNGESVPDVPVVVLQTFEDCLELLWGHAANNKTQKQLDHIIQLFNESYDRLDGKSLVHYVDAANALFTRAMQTVLKDNHLKRSARHNKAYLDCIKVAVETYVMHGIYKKIFKGISVCRASEDAKLNKINRNLAELQLRDLGVRAEFRENIPKAKKELQTLNRYSTPLGKLNCIKKVVTILMQPPRRWHTKQTQEEQSALLTTDDLLPILVFLVVKSEIPNWFAHLTYMLKFRFSKANNDDEYGFYAASTEAAIEHVYSGSLSSLQLGTANPQPLVLARSQLQGGSGCSSADSADSMIGKLFQYVRDGKTQEVEKMLNKKEVLLEEAKQQMCHPLCSCDRCEQVLARSRNDASAVTAYSRDDRGFTALHVSALCGNVHVMNVLIHRGGVVNATDYHGSTPLHIACQRGHQKVVLLLLDQGANFNAADNDGNTPLHLCAANGHEECVKAVIFMGRSKGLDLNAGNDWGETPLHLASKWGYEGIVKILLENEALPTVTNRKHLSPLQCSSNVRVSQMLSEAIEENTSMRTFETVDTMLESIESVSDMDSLGPRKHSFKKQFESGPGLSRHFNSQEPSLPIKVVSQSLVDKKDYKKIDKLLKTVARNDIEMVKFILGWTDDLEEEMDIDMTKRTLCHPLCQCDKCMPVQMLTTPRTDVTVNMSNVDGYAPLHVASRYGFKDLIMLFIKRGANVNARSKVSQWTPLHLACQYDQAEAVELLLDHGAKINAKNVNGVTPLHMCCFQGNPRAASVLLQHGASVDLTDHQGNTPLHTAAKRNDLNLVQLLLIHGSSVRAKNNKKISPIQLAKHDKVIMLLDEAYSKVPDLPQEDVQPSPEKEKRRPHGQSTVRAAVNKKSSMHDLFSAFEEQDLKRLQNLVGSIRTFNPRASLRHTVTLDKSLPRFDKHLTQQLEIQHFDIGRLKHVETRDKSKPVIQAEFEDKLTGDVELGLGVSDECKDRVRKDYELDDMTKSQGVDNLSGSLAQSSLTFDDISVSSPLVEGTRMREQNAQLRESFSSWDDVEEEANSYPGLRTNGNDGSLNCSHGGQVEQSQQISQEDGGQDGLSASSLDTHGNKPDHHDNKSDHYDNNPKCHDNCLDLLESECHENYLVYQTTISDHENDSVHLDNKTDHLDNKTDHLDNKVNSSSNVLESIDYQTSECNKRQDAVNCEQVNPASLDHMKRENSDIKENVQSDDLIKQDSGLCSNPAELQTPSIY
ncbi:ankyrin repeat domain-containing protein 27 isoform X2 [Lingula anatina]|uniref:Ankyrin repeat domain-containing protein 27 isoform X2 n=1 Tax=Lingula anatina TaxID=7574 RepID=A0A1S3JKZ4_LINAN|nr:ankyrin repeat domain-containing protein 27 isoform X2 [Lingula anatina]|eukprot:XP_013410574.1 ankyrin repeat domain-containing protein 27 isoform X2 [Lingula anatina]